MIVVKKADKVSAEGVSIFTRGGRWQSNNNMNACIITNACHKGHIHAMKRSGASERLSDSPRSHGKELVVATVASSQLS